MFAHLPQVDLECSNTGAASAGVPTNAGRRRAVQGGGCACKAKFNITTAKAPKGHAFIRVYEADHVSACIARGGVQRFRSPAARLFLDLLVSANMGMRNEWIVRKYQEHFAKPQMTSMKKTFDQIQVPGSA